MDEAIVWWRKACERAASTNDVEAVGYALLNIAMVSTQLANFDAAEEAFLEAVATGHPEIAPKALVSLAIVYKRTGRAADARWCYERALDIVSEDPDLLSQARQGLATLDRGVA
ncbi:MAG: tetratricopeptide repeat protein [Solirubrobacteraceae bacterium]